jgi:hypothetical protein
MAESPLGEVDGACIRVNKPACMQGLRGWVRSVDEGNKARGGHGHIAGLEVVDLLDVVWLIGGFQRGVGVTNISDSIEVCRSCFWAVEAGM